MNRDEPRVADSVVPTGFVYGHRGAPLERPENTMESFQLALDLGVTHLESDVHMTSDGEIVMSHDDTGLRMANVPHEIRRTAWRDVHTWDAGFGFLDASGARPFAERGVRFPRLHDVIDAFPDTPLNLDLKQTEPAMVDVVVKLLKDRGADLRVTLASFSDDNLAKARVHHRGPLALSRRQVVAVLTLPLAVLKRQRKGRPLRAQVPVRAGPISLTSGRFIARCRALSIGLDYWTINDDTVARALLEKGADGIMTDDARRIVPAIQSALKR